MSAETCRRCGRLIDLAESPDSEWCSSRCQHLGEGQPSEPQTDPERWAAMLAHDRERQRNANNGRQTR